TLTLVQFFYDSLIMRNTMIEILGEDFIVTAEAKGLSNRIVMFRHAARNAMLPLVTGVAMSFGFMLTGTIFIEIVFNYPGLGHLLINSINARDYPVAQGIFILITIITILANIVADVLYAILDPRVKLTAR
ncbi:MAG: ABC transporter permease, partial [Candidatus Bathyarchaeia archaeon]